MADSVGDCRTCGYEGVDGVGEKYGGIYYVDRVTHKFAFEGYTQEFALIRNAYGDNLEVSSSLLDAVL